VRCTPPIERPDAAANAAGLGRTTIRSLRRRWRRAGASASSETERAHVERQLLRVGAVDFARLAPGVSPRRAHHAQQQLAIVTRRRLFCAMVRAATPSCASTDPCARARTDHVERRISALSGTQSKRFGERKKKNHQ
jgi:hypothetical protein